MPTTGENKLEVNEIALHKRSEDEQKIKGFLERLKAKDELVLIKKFIQDRQSAWENTDNQSIASLMKNLSSLDFFKEDWVEDPIETELIAFLTESLKDLNGQKILFSFTLKTSDGNNDDHNKLQKVAATIFESMILTNHFLGIFIRDFLEIEEAQYSPYFTDEFIEGEKWLPKRMETTKSHFLSLVDFKLSAEIAILTDRSSPDGHGRSDKFTEGYKVIIFIEKR